MKIRHLIIISSLGLPAGAFILVAWLSRRLGRKVWSPEVFAWRNSLRIEPLLENQHGSPVSLVNPRHYSFTNIGSSVGTVLNVDLKNISNKPIHSYMVSFDSLTPSDTGGSGIHPEEFLMPGESSTFGRSATSEHRITVQVEFIQFADGSAWLPNPPGKFVKPEGVEAGARGVKNYLRDILELKGATAVMKILPQVPRKLHYMDIPNDESLYGETGIRCGVTKAILQIEDAHKNKGLSGVKELLMDCK